jgi:hypothetical protein
MRLNDSSPDGIKEPFREKRTAWKISCYPQLTFELIQPERDKEIRFIGRAQIN